jgi:signal peptidase II
LSSTGKKLAALFVPAGIVVILDQITKFKVRTDSSYHYYELIEGWLAFNFTKNPGMALGMDWLSTPVISTIAIIATIVIIGYILYNLSIANMGYLICMGLIVGGALGNIIDRIFMGIIGGYGGVLDGHVVDFIHFTLRINDWPVFPYIFNVADVAISTSIIILLLFHNKLMPVQEKIDTQDAEGNEPSINAAVTETEETLEEGKPDTK